MRAEEKNLGGRKLLAARLLLTAALLATVAFIFHNSLQAGERSGMESQRVLQWLQSALRALGLKALALALTDHLVRKLAHFAEYALLGFWLLLWARAYTRRLARCGGWLALFALLVALSDETLQLFSLGRTGQVADVWLDFSGALAGLLCGLLFLWLWAWLWRLAHPGKPSEERK